MRQSSTRIHRVVVWSAYQILLALRPLRPGMKKRLVRSMPGVPVFGMSTHVGQGSLVRQAEEQGRISKTSDTQRTRRPTRDGPALVHPGGTEAANNDISLARRTKRRRSTPAYTSVGLVRSGRAAGIEA